MTIINRVGSVDAPNAPVVVAGEEKSAVSAMGGGASYWRAFDKSFSGVNTPDMRWLPRKGGVTLSNYGASENPEFVNGDVPYIAFDAFSPEGHFRSPVGVNVIPATAFAIIVNVYQPLVAAGVILGNHARMTISSSAENDAWIGVSTGARGNEDDLAGACRGQNNIVTAPDEMSFKDNLWHTVSLLYSPGSTNYLRLRVDGSEIADTADVNAPRNALRYRQMLVGAAADQGAIYAPFTGRINAIAVIPADLHGTLALDEIEGYFMGVVGAG